MKTKLLMMFAVVGVTLLSSSAFGLVDNFTFDPDGVPGGLAPIPQTKTFDWAVDNALAVGSSTAINNFVLNAGDGGTRPTTFNLYYQARLSGLFNVSGGNVTPAGTGTVREYTIVAGFQENVIAVFGPPGTPGNTAQFASTGVAHGSGPVDAAGNLAANYAELYYDTPANAVPLTGAGYNDGTRILRATVDSSGGAPTTVFTLIGGGAGTPLDANGSDNYPLIDSVLGTGATSLTATVIPGSEDPNFFLERPVMFSLFNTTNTLNFTQVDPAAAFAESPLGVAPVTAGAGLGVISLGVVNGGGSPPFGTLGGPDVQFQADGNQTFLVEPQIPEPLTAGLGMMGLASLALAVLRRRVA